MHRTLQQCPSSFEGTKRDDCEFRTLFSQKREKNHQPMCESRLQFLGCHKRGPSKENVPVSFASAGTDFAGQINDRLWPTVLDMDSTEIPVNEEQEQSAYNRHSESTCYHPLGLFNGEGDCEAAQLRPGNAHGVDG
jgi:hypothetical protein